MPRWRGRHRGVTAQPLALHQIVELLAPEKSGISLTRDQLFLRAERCLQRGCIEEIRLFTSLGKNVAKAVVEGSTWP
jgi:hypothetical protein